MQVQALYSQAGGVRGAALTTRVVAQPRLHVLAWSQSGGQGPAVKRTRGLAVVNAGRSQGHSMGWVNGGWEVVRLWQLAALSCGSVILSTSLRGCQRQCWRALCHVSWLGGACSTQLAGCVFSCNCLCLIRQLSLINGHRVAAGLLCTANASFCCAAAGSRR